MKGTGKQEEDRMRRRRTERLARTVALRVCISMREGSEKGKRLREETRGEKGAAGEAEGRVERGTEAARRRRRRRTTIRTRCRSGRTRAKKVSKKRLFELSLCAKQLPRAATTRANAGREGRSDSLFSPASPISRIDAARVNARREEERERER